MIELNKIYNCDCLEMMMGGKINNSVDLILTDPPYEFINKNPQGWWFMNKENEKHIRNV